MCVVDYSCWLHVLSVDNYFKPEMIGFFYDGETTYMGEVLFPGA